jgi:exopolysaccharide biosynthesis polyprenyl glycosylphosphotransferase
LRQLDLHGSQRRRPIPDLIGRLAAAGAASMVIVAAGAFIASVPVPSVFPLEYAAAQLLFLAPIRFGAVTGLRLLRRHAGRNYRNVVIVGSGPRAQAVRRKIEQNPGWGQRVLGFVDDGEPPEMMAVPRSRVHKLADLPELFRRYVIDEVIVACPRSMLAEVGPAIAACASVGVPITVPSDLFGDYLPPPRVTTFDTMAALRFAPVHHGRVQLAVKRVIDVVGSSVLLLASGPLIAAAAALVRSTSPGPAFYRQLRCGLNGRPFTMWKLRTMCADADRRKEELRDLNEMDGPVFKIRNDPRLTPLGRHLRRWSIDELPQLWNVLRGDMSLVGPRPLPVEEVAGCEMWQRRRLSMPPGITCLWQVRGRNEIGFEDWVKLDLEYVDGWSLARDVRILLATVRAVFRGKGAS